MQRTLKHAMQLTAWGVLSAVTALPCFAEEIIPQTAAEPTLAVPTLRSVSISEVLPGGLGRGPRGPHGVAGAPISARGGHPLCAQIIEMLFRANVHEQYGGTPQWDPFFPLDDPDLGDMELLSIGIVSEASPGCAPLVSITFRNNSLECLKRFSISAVAVLGQIDVASPLVSVRVPEMQPGETQSVELQLPATAMALSPDGQTLAPFDTLVVVLDSYDEFIETDKLNNIAILRASELTVLAPVQQQIEEVAPGAQPPTDASEMPQQETPEAVPFTRPGSGIDFDSLDLGDAFSQAAPQ